MRHALQRNIDKDIKYLLSEPVVERCSVKKVLLEISQDSHARVSFLINLQA